MSSERGRKTVVVAMSGGVDSSVSAALLRQEGYDVIGITMCFNLPDPDEGKPLCCGPQAISDARRVAGMLDIPHYVLGFSDELKDKVVDNFREEYARGRTPNPCILCNEHLKFNTLLAKAMAYGADYLATGHYARIVDHGGPRLARAADPSKDQTYFLYRLSAERMKKILFPIGEYEKPRIREIAGELGLPIAEKPDSQEVCFIPDKEALEKLRGGAEGPGNFVDTAGNVLGRHDGVSHYTIGQRRGLGVSAADRLYVVRLDTATNTVVLGDRDDVYSKGCRVSGMSWPDAPMTQPARMNVRIRHVHREAPAEIIPEGEGARIIFDEPQFAVTPGQSAVFYDGDIVMGGGFIDEAI